MHTQDPASLFAPEELLQIFAELPDEEPSPIHVPVDGSEGYLESSAPSMWEEAHTVQRRRLNLRILRNVQVVGGVRCFSVPRSPLVLSRRLWCVCLLLQEAAGRVSTNFSSRTTASSRRLLWIVLSRGVTRVASRCAVPSCRQCRGTVSHGRLGWRRCPVSQRHGVSIDQPILRRPRLLNGHRAKHPTEGSLVSETPL